MNYRGHSGTPVRVKTNAFKITQLPTENYHHYDVIVQRNVRNRETGLNENKEVKPGQSYVEIIDQMQLQYQAQFVKRVSYDGLRNLYSPLELQGATMFEVRVPRGAGRVSVFDVELRHVRVIYTGIFAHLTSPQGGREVIRQSVECTTAVGLLQVLVSQAPHMRNNFSLHAKSFYSDEVAAIRNIARGLCAVSGIFQSVRPVLHKFIVNVDTTTAAFYQAGSLIDVAMNFYSDGRSRLGVREFVTLCKNRFQFEKLRRFLKGVAIQVHSDCGGARRRIKDLVEEAGPYVFEKGPANEPTTVEEHYRVTYRKSLQRPYLFGVVCEGGAVFPAEFCFVLPGQRYKKKLDPDQITEFLKHSVKDPGPRLRAIQDAVSGRLLGYDSSPYMLDANMQIETTPLEIDARQLRPPIVQYGDNVAADTGRNPGAWNVVGKKLWAPVKVSHWAVVNFDNADATTVIQFLRRMASNMHSLGITFGVPPERAVIEVGNQNNPEHSLNEADRRMLTEAPAEFKKTAYDIADFRRKCIIIVLLPLQALELRKRVKYWGDTQSGVSTQCVRAPKYRNVNDQYCNNVALKINAKLDGVNSLPVSDEIAAMLTGTMVVGCDVSHPAPGIRDRPSLASVVYSYNSTATKYGVFVNCLEPRLEIIDGLVEALGAAGQNYGKRNEKLPKTVLIYRDGVSEGEYQQVIQREILPIKNTYGDKFQLVFIVVGKRHHVRFFPQDGSHSQDRKGNCLPGLVVDSGVVHSSLPDFYLQSHAGLIGTSRPSHYVVLHNDPGWSIDNLQKLSYHLCYFYAVATRSVSIPAPVYYADRACTRAAYQFDPEARPGDYEHESNSATNTGEFNVKQWRDALRHPRFKEKMYFI